MPNLMETAASWLGDQLKTLAGRTVSVSAGTQVVSGIVGFVTVNEYEVIDADGFLTRTQSHDWSLKAEDLIGLKYQGGPTVTITDENGQRFEVGPVGSKPAVEEMDTAGVLVVLHSKKVSNA